MYLIPIIMILIMIILLLYAHKIKKFTIPKELMIFASIILLACALSLFGLNIKISHTNYVSKINNEEQTERVLIKNKHKNNIKLKDNTKKLRDNVNKINTNQIHKVRHKINKYALFKKYKKHPVKNDLQMINYITQF